jgi:hypothetical protein
MVIDVVVVVVPLGGGTTPPLISKGGKVTRKVAELVTT